jgi:arsenite-transporting ATPase
MARKQMQDKSIGQCFDLSVEDFHVTLMPLLDFEVRGTEKLKEFLEFLTDPVDIEGYNCSSSGSEAQKALAHII